MNHRSIKRTHVIYNNPKEMKNANRFISYKKRKKFRFSFIEKRLKSETPKCPVGDKEKWVEKMLRIKY